MSPGSRTHSSSGRKRRSTFSGARGSSSRRAARRDPPTAPAAALQQEHVVRVDVRPDAAAGRRVAHHHVVEAARTARTRNARSIRSAAGTKWLSPCTSRVQRRAGSAAQRWPGGSGPCSSAQRAPSPLDEPRFAVVARREPKEIAHRHRIGEARPRAAHQQRPLLPVVGAGIRAARARRGAFAACAAARATGRCEMHYMRRDGARA